MRIWSRFTRLLDAHHMGGKGLYIGYPGGW
jgi:hypothetical protein